MRREGTYKDRRRHMDAMWGECGAGAGHARAAVSHLTLTLTLMCHSTAPKAQKADRLPDAFRSCTRTCGSFCWVSLVSRGHPPISIQILWKMKEGFVGVWCIVWSDGAFWEFMELMALAASAIETRLGLDGSCVASSCSSSCLDFWIGSCAKLIGLISEFSVRNPSQLNLKPLVPWTWNLPAKATSASYYGCV
jgi:hypothetical protein